MKRKVINAWRMSKVLGPTWLAYRLGYAVRLRTGMFRYQLPPTSWEQQPLENFLRDTTLADPERYLAFRRSQCQPFFFTPTQRAHYQTLLTKWNGNGDGAVAATDALLQGMVMYFSHIPVELGCPPDWHYNPFAGMVAPRDLHWSDIDDFAAGDIKLLWEPNRFSFVYALVRAYWCTGDERYAELFWQLVSDWRLHNPPQQGVNWKCGQEISFRVMAWCFGLYGVLEAQATTPERVAMLAQMIAVSGQRIAGNLSYALSQSNNHGISEGTGLWTIGLLFPELRDAQRWRETGREVLESQAAELIYPDGSFSQHSVNYHRVMLQDYVWSLRLGELLGHTLSPELHGRVQRATQWLYLIQDESSGQVPRYGHNDGALVLPLSTCDYQDFRPSLQAAYYATGKTCCYGDGPWNEELLWLFGPEALTAGVVPPERTDLHANDGGYYTLRSAQGFAFTRCGSFRHRPAHADLLHVDLWWRGQNVARDAGTYSYNAPAPWTNPFAHSPFHNTVTVDNLDQMERVNRFLWLPWATGQRCRSEQSPQKIIAYWEGEHDGYQRLPMPVTYRRGILRLGEEWWMVIDTLWSNGPHHYRLHWLCPDVPYAWNENTATLALQTEAGAYFMQMAAIPVSGTSSLVRADPYSPRGWEFPYYAVRQPVLSVDLSVVHDAPQFFTLWGPQPAQLRHGEATLEILTDEWQATLQWEREEQGNGSHLRQIVLNGKMRETLTLVS